MKSAITSLPLHAKQSMDVYYAKPRLMQKSTGEVGAFYVFTEECESIFPVKADGFFSMERMEISESFIRYYIFSEERLLEGLYDYEKFIQYMLDHGATYYDKSHILVPSMTKEQIEVLAGATLKEG